MSTSKTKLDAGLVRELAAILREADLGEVEIEHEGLRIRVSKATSMESAMNTPIHLMFAPWCLKAAPLLPVVMSGVKLGRVTFLSWPLIPCIPSDTVMRLTASWWVSALRRRVRVRKSKPVADYSFFLTAECSRRGVLPRPESIQSAFCLQQHED